MLVAPETRVTTPDDANRVAAFVLDWLGSTQPGLDLPSQRVMAGRITSGARSRPGCQLYWTRGDEVVAACSIQLRAAAGGSQVMLQLRISRAAWSDGSANSIADEARGAARRRYPDGQLSILLPGGDPLGEALAAEGFAISMELVTMTRLVRPQTPEVQAPDGVSIRPLRPGQDEDAFVAVQREVFSSDPLGAGMTADDIRHQLELGIVQPDDFFLAEIRGKLVGVARSVFDADGRNPDGGPFAEIVGNGVLASHRRHGIGQALIRAQIAHLRERGGYVGLPDCDLNQARADGALRAYRLRRVGKTVHLAGPCYSWLTALAIG